jgi:hypothetical protein
MTVGAAEDHAGDHASKNDHKRLKKFDQPSFGIEKVMRGNYF